MAINSEMLHTYTYIHTCMHTYIHTYMHACMITVRSVEKNDTNRRGGGLGAGWL
jgi:hypothetical protein